MSAPAACARLLFCRGFGRLRGTPAPPPPKISRQRYNYYVRSQAWQVLASASYDETALDTIGGFVFGRRNTDERIANSPFAVALLDGLAGQADTNLPEKVGDPVGDGLITANELFDFVQFRVEEQAGNLHYRQSPGLWSLQKQDAGRYVFKNPQQPLALHDVEPLTDKNGPYRGLRSYDYTKADSDLFFGRAEQIQELKELIERQSFLMVVGASGIGKSSLVKAGLMPVLSPPNNPNDPSSHLDDGPTPNNGRRWKVLPPLRPSATPLAALEKLITDNLPTYWAQVNTIADADHWLESLVTAWWDANPGVPLVLVIDQLEELVTLCSEAERSQFQTLLANALTSQPDHLRVVVTLRSDYEPQIANGPLSKYWTKEGRYSVPTMLSNDLRQVIVEPGLKRELYFESSELIDKLINDVVKTSSGVPLLSFTLEEMYFRYIANDRGDRTLGETEYDAVGGVIGSLRKSANLVYENLPDDTHRSMMRRIMLRMIAAEAGDVARRRVYLEELDYGAAENQQRDKVLEALEDRRLVMRGIEGASSWAEPAHDALVSGWDKLMEWRLEAATYLQLQHEVALAALKWHAADKQAQNGLLWDKDPRLSQLQSTLWPPPITRIPSSISQERSASKGRCPIAYTTLSKAV